MFEDGTVVAYGQGVLKKDGSVIEYHGTEIKKLIVNEGVTGIGGSLCYNLPYLKSVFLPESVTKIGTGCFAECTSLQEVTLPSNLQTIAYDVFKNCYSLQKVTMPSNLNHIGTSTFENCKNLKEILLPDTLSSIGENAFKGCSVLKAINIPGNVKEIGDSAFEECVSLDEITIPHSIVLGKGVFCSCTALKTVIFEADPELSKIPNYAFENCISLTSVTFSDNTSDIGNNAFSGCVSLSEITLPKELIELGMEAFKECTSLKNVHFTNTQPCRIGEAAFQYCSSLESINIVGDIGADAFNSCTNLKTAHISDGYIWGRAFKDCINLTEITLPENLGWIDEEVFSGCTSLKNISLDGYLFEIRKKAFYNCSSLREIILPHTFYALENEAFVGCSNLESITFLYDEQNAAWDEWPFIDPSAVEGCVNLKTIYGYNGWGLDYDAKKIGAEFIALDKTPDVIPSFSIELGKYSETDAVKIFWKKCPDVSGYEMEISSSSDFSQWADTSVYRKLDNTQDFTYWFEAEPDCTYYVRMRAYNHYVETSYGEWSQPKSFIITRDKLTPTITPSPTATPAPTDTPKPTAVPKPTTAPKPTTIPTPSKAPSPQTPSSKPTIKVNMSSLVLKTRQSSSALKVTGLAPGDFVKSWKSGNTKIVTVTGKPNGTCKLKAGTKSGKTTLTITLNSGLTKKIPVRVQKTTVRTQKITGIPKKLVLQVKKKATLKPVILPLTSTEKITYKSSNKKVATVSAKGVIAAKKKGTATITVKSGKKSVKCKVTVK